MSTPFSVPRSLGAGRFKIIRHLGEGAMGVVYLACDLVRQDLVALKLLRSLEPKHLYRFKREFRAASQIHHPNVVCLYELMQEQGYWFFTMEYVQGRHFLDAVCTEPRQREQRRPCTQETMSLIGASDLMDGVDTTSLQCGQWPPVMGQHNALRPRLSDRLELGVLRAVLIQLAEAIGAMHARGILHRDIKPSNVMVTNQGRVALADFSIALELQQRHSRARTEDGVVLGTPAFMAPEQIYPRTVTAAVDWYSFGSMMYVALTGHYPYPGDAHAMLYDKQNSDAIAPRHHMSGIPEELEDLCMRLLRREPRERPQLAEVLDVLRARPRAPAVPRAWAAIAPDTPADNQFVGRRRELTRLHEMRSHTDEGASQCVLVQGPCGIGKSRLLAQFRREMADRTEVSPLVVTTRCHEREKIPHKAFDGLLEQMGQFLSTFADEQRAAVVGDWEALTATFPCIRYAAHCAPQATPLQESPARLRRRGYRALRRALSAFLRHQPLIVCIDDLHWADTDSLDLLRYLMESPVVSDTPGLYLVAAFSSDIMGQFHNLQFAEFVTSVLRCRNFIHLPLAPLSEREQHLMLAATVESDVDLNRAWGLHGHSNGHPGLLCEIAQRVMARAQPARSDALDGLRPMYWEHVQSLEAGARSLAVVIALAGESLPVHVLADAADLSMAATQRALARLCEQRLTRISDSGDEVWVDVYHQAIRVAVRYHLELAERQTLLAALVRALESWDAAPNALLRHHRNGASDAGIAIPEHLCNIPTPIAEEPGSAGCSHS